jgi:surface antigen
VPYNSGVRLFVRTPTKLEKNLKALLFSLVVLLSGCATQVVPLNVTGLESSEATQAQDLRPPKEKQGEIFSLLITSEAYATYRIADSSLTPSAIRLLQHRFHERFGSASKAPELKVYHLVIYRNMQAEFRRSAIGAGIGGALGAVIGGQSVKSLDGSTSSRVESANFDALESAEYKRSWYTEAENPGRGSVHVIYIETEANGKRVFTKTISPMTAKSGEIPIVTAIEAAVSYHLSQY